MQNRDPNNEPSIRRSLNEIPAAVTRLKPASPAGFRAQTITASGLVKNFRPSLNFQNTAVTKIKTLNYQLITVH